jgi:methylenetetrahydrofolate dehydrogenase (NADP+)/methenyltetrahydrofolate cyclohydrolase
LNILDSLNLDLNTMNIVVLGQGALVGRPVSHILLERGLDVKIINTKTENSFDLIKKADIIISAIGQGKFITGEIVKKGVVIIDAGTSEENGAIIGDVELESVSKVASYITPSPGGVGPVTVAMLLKNVLMVAENKK